MRVGLLIPTLGPGGAERVITALANALAARGHEVSLVTLAAVGSDFFTVDAGVQRVGLDLMRDSRSLLEALMINLQRMRRLRAAIRAIDPGAVVAFTTSMNVLTLLACIGLRRVRTVASERVDPAAHRGERSWRLLRRWLYPRAYALVVQTAGAAAWFRNDLGKRPPIVVIPNPLIPFFAGSGVVAGTPAPYLLSVGRLVHQKGFDLLIRSFSLIAKDYTDINLVIAGEGQEAASLHALVAQLKLEDRVYLAGRVQDVPALMRSALAFVLASRYEGFPNVLIEALGAGLPVVATDCPGGSREILEGGEFGILVPSEDERALAAALRTLLTDAELRRQLSAKTKAAVSRYSPDSVFARWEQLLSQP